MCLHLLLLYIVAQRQRTMAVLEEAAQLEAGLQDLFANDTVLGPLVPTPLLNLELGPIHYTLLALAMFPLIMDLDVLLLRNATEIDSHQIILWLLLIGQAIMAEFRTRWPTPIRDC
jgi:hypothetical protein